MMKERGTQRVALSVSCVPGGEGFGGGHAVFVGGADDRGDVEGEPAELDAELGVVD